MKWIATASIILAFALLGAHFWRNAGLAAGVLSLAPLALLAFGRRWADRLLGGLLLAGAVVWLSSLWRAVGIRQAAERPWGRLALILGAVALFTFLSALLAVKRRRDGKGME